MARKHKPEEHVNHERWLVSYADFITLLFAFFVILYALSEVDKNKLKKLRDSVQFAFHHIGSGGTNTMGNQVHQKKPNLIGDKWPQGDMKANAGPHEPLTGVVQYLESSLVKHFVREDRAKVEVIDDGKAIIVRMPAERLFPPSAATLRPDRLRFLEDLGWCIQRFNLKMEVNVEVELPFSHSEVEEHQLASRRADALFSGIWKANVAHRVNMLTRVMLREQVEVGPGDAVDRRSVVEFRVTF